MVYKENKTTWQKKEGIKHRGSICQIGRDQQASGNPDTNLKDSMTLYAEGVELANACKEELAGVERR